MPPRTLPRWWPEAGKTRKSISARVQEKKSVHNQLETVRLKSTERDERAPTPNWLSEREESAEKGNNGTDRQSSSLQVGLKRH